MTVPPPYDPVLLREHAFHETGVASLVLAPGINDGNFHSVAEKGLGIFGYRFADQYEIERFDNTRLANFLWVLVLLTTCYHGLKYLLKERTVPRESSSASATVVGNSLLSPFSHKRVKSQDVESGSDFSDGLDENSLPMLSYSVTNTPQTPELHNNFTVHQSFDESKLLHFIQGETYTNAKMEKIH